MGIVLVATALILAARHLASINVFGILLLAGVITYLWGCAAWARAKGYTAAQGIFLGIAFPPALLLFIFFDRTKMSKKERDEEARQEAAEERAYRAARRRPLKGSKKIFAWLLGLLFLTVSLTMIVGYEIYWARVIMPERRGMATSVTVRADKIDPQNDSKLVHVSGELGGVENLSDPAFGVAVDALRLRRRVWMYQWEENGQKSSFSSGTIDARGNTKTDYKATIYNYDKVWSEGVIDSRAFHNFGHDNPGEKKIPDRTVAATNITLGVFAVASELVKQIDNFQIVPVNDKNLSAMAEPLRSRAKLLGNEIYIGANADQPAIGDLKIEFEFAPATNASVIAQQAGNNLAPYAVAKSGSIAQLQIGTISVQEMTSRFAKDEFQRRMIVWVAGGVLLLCGSFLVHLARRRQFAL